MTRWWLAGLALFLSWATGACSVPDPAPTPSPTPAATAPSSASPPPTPPPSTPPPTSSTSTTSTTAPDFVVATYDSTQTDGGMQAVLFGTGVIQNGCFFLRPDDPEPDGPELVLPVFPGQRVRIEGSQTYYNEDLLREGDRIELGGGFARSSAGADRPEGCRGQRIVFMVGDY